MIALYILLGLVALVLLILFSSASLKVSVGDDLLVSVRFWFLKFTFPGEKKKPKKTKVKKQKETEVEGQQHEKQGYIKKMISEKGIAATVSELSSIVRSILAEFDKLLKHVRIRRFKLFINVASDDPALTAVEYGAVCAAVFPVTRLIETKTKLSRSNTEVSVNSDFITGRSKITFDTKIKLRVIFALIAGVNVIIPLVKIKIKEQTKTETNNLKSLSKK